MLEKLFQLIKDEPVAFREIIYSGLLLLMAFGTVISTQQLSSIMIFVGAVLTFLTRRAVTPNHIAAERVQVALNTPVPPANPGSPMEQLRP